MRGEERFWLRGEERFWLRGEERFWLRGKDLVVQRGKVLGAQQGKVLVFLVTRCEEGSGCGGSRSLYIRVRCCLSCMFLLHATTCYRQPLSALTISNCSRPNRLFHVLTLPVLEVFPSTSPKYCPCLSVSPRLVCIRQRPHAQVPIPGSLSGVREQRPLQPSRSIAARKPWSKP